MEDNLKKNGRQPKQKIEDDLKKNKMEDNLKKKGKKGGRPKKK